MKLSDKITRIILAAIIIVSLGISTGFEAAKQGFHEDELLTYNLANSDKKLGVDAQWNEYGDFLDYLAAGDYTQDPSKENGSHRFDYGNVIQNQIIDASHPPLYYALVHTVCSFFPDVFSKWLAYAVNVIMMACSLIMIFRIGKRVTDSNLYALIATGGYGLSIACVTMTIYLRMYTSLMFWTLAFAAVTLRIYDRGSKVKITDFVLMLFTVTAGILTQYYFILMAGLTGLVFLIFKLKERSFKQLVFYIVTALIGAALAMAAYPHIIENVLGGNRGLGSLKLDIDMITVVTYVMYKLFCYVQILAKEMFIGQVWLLIAVTVVAIGGNIYLRAVKKKKLPRKAWFIIVPGVVFFLGIALVSPFNSDRYVAASLPLISMMFTFAYIRIVNLIKNVRIHPVLPAAMVCALALSFVFVKPYYVYGETNLYEPKTKKAAFVGTAMMEWNKCIDKFMNYDGVIIAKTTEMSKTLFDELDEFANSRGVITNGKVSAIAQSFMTNGDVERIESDSVEKLCADSEFNAQSEITVYISRLADSGYVTDSILKNSSYKNYELIQADREFGEFFNWYDYFVETESYCNVYRFYK